MSNVTDIDDHQPHEAFEAMCVQCYARWIAIVRVGVLLKKLECKKCGPGFVIRTGQPMDE